MFLFFDHTFKKWIHIGVQEGQILIIFFISKGFQSVKKPLRKLKPLNLSCLSSTKYFTCTCPLKRCMEEISDLTPPLAG